MEPDASLRPTTVRALAVAGLVLSVATAGAAHWTNTGFALAPGLSGAGSFVALSGVAVLSLFLVVGKRAGRRVVAVYLGLMLLVAAESVATGAQLVSRLGATGHHTPRLASPMKGHPFLHVFNGLGLELNEAGFPGREMRYDKNPDVVRVACVGGSTTALGYPAELERALNASGDGRRYEVYNFGMFAWTSTHSVVNFAINIVDYQPDVVVLHHAINDLALMQDEGCCRDYSHALAPVVAEAPSPAQTFVRSFALGRLLTDGPAAAPGPGSEVPKGTAPCPRERSCSALAASPLERNLETMVKLARASDMLPVLTTQPIQTDWGRGHFPEEDRYWADAPEVNNAIRSLADKLSDDAIFVDLDALMTQPAQRHFTDMCHLDHEGRRTKARHLAAAIRSSLDDRQMSRMSQRTAARPAPRAGHF